MSCLTMLVLALRIREKFGIAVLGCYRCMLGFIISLIPLESELPIRLWLSWRPLILTLTSEIAYEEDFGRHLALGLLPFLPNPISLPVRFLTSEFFVDRRKSFAFSIIDESAFRVELCSRGNEFALPAPSLIKGGPAASRLYCIDRLRAPF